MVVKEKSVIQVIPRERPLSYPALFLPGASVVLYPAQLFDTPRDSQVLLLRLVRKNR